MEETLKQILAELKLQTAEIKFQRQLMQDLFHSKDAKNHNAQHIQKRMASLVGNISNMPGMDQPQAKALLNDIMGIIPGG